MKARRLPSTLLPTDRQGGAARMTVFLALWSLALVALHDVRVDAAPIYEAAAPESNWSAAPTPVPRVDAPTLWNAFAECSDVISGRWSPGRKSAARRRSDRHAAGVRTAVAVVAQPVARSGAPSSAEPSKSSGSIAIVPHADSNAIEVDRSTPTKAVSLIAEAERHVASQIASGELDAATASIERARASIPDGNARLRLLDARVAMARGDFERAYTQLLESLPDIRKTTEQHELLAAAMLRTGRFAESATVYGALLRVDPRNARWWAGYAMSQNELGHRTDALAAYRALQSLVQPGTPLSSWATQQIERMT
jgi:hypothetical protein